MLNRIYSNYCSFCHEAYKYEVVRQEVIMIIPRQSVIHSVIYFYIENYWIESCLKLGSKLCQKCCGSCIIIWFALKNMDYMVYVLSVVAFMNHVLNNEVWKFTSWHKGICSQITLFETYLLYKDRPIIPGLILSFLGI